MNENDIILTDILHQLIDNPLDERLLNNYISEVRRRKPIQIYNSTDFLFFQVLYEDSLTLSWLDEIFTDRVNKYKKNIWSFSAEDIKKGIIRHVVNDRNSFMLSIFQQSLPEEYFKDWLFRYREKLRMDIETDYIYLQGTITAMLDREVLPYEYQSLSAFLIKYITKDTLLKDDIFLTSKYLLRNDYIKKNSCVFLDLLKTAIRPLIVQYKNSLH